MCNQFFCVENYLFTIVFLNMIFGWHNARMRCGWRIKRNSCSSCRNLAMGIFFAYKKPMNFFMSCYRRKCRDSNPDTAFAMDVLAGHWDTITPHLPGAVHRIRTCRSFPTNCFQDSFLTSPDIRHIRHILVRPTGLEPALAKANCPLKTACLPNFHQERIFCFKIESRWIQTTVSLTVSKWYRFSATLWLASKSYITIIFN